MARNLVPDNFIQPQDVESRSIVADIPILSAKVWDAPLSSLPTTSSADDLGITVGTWGTSAPVIQTSDLKAAGATSRYARFQWVVPKGFDAVTPSLKLRLNGDMDTTVADTSATIDAVVYENSGASISADLCATAAQSINSLTPADKDFTITATSLSEGDVLDIRVAITVTDAATGTSVVGKLNSVKMVYNARL